MTGQEAQRQPLPAPTPDRQTEQIAEMEAMQRMMLAQLNQRHTANDRGRVTRLIGDYLGYLVLEEGRSLCFTPDRIPEFDGRDWATFGISVGAEVQVGWKTDTGEVTSVRATDANETRPRAVAP